MCSVRGGRSSAVCAALIYRIPALTACRGRSWLCGYDGAWLESEETACRRGSVFRSLVSAAKILMAQFSRIPRGDWRALLLAVVPAAGSAEPATYVIDPEHVTVGFRVEHLGFASVVGFFRDVEGSYVFDEETGALTDIDVRIRTASVFSNHADRDEHVRSRNFLNSNQYSEMRFSMVSVERIDDRRFEIVGALELLGIRNPLRLAATWNKSGPYPIGRGIYAMGVSAAAMLSRSDYGMDYAVDNGWVGDQVEIFVEFEARRN
jgi:polyisoprenoid-binding protein YceI